MAVTVSQLIKISCPVVMSALGKPYRLHEIYAQPEGGYRAMLIDRDNSTYAAISWTQADEIGNRNENQTVSLVESLLWHAARMLDGLREEATEMQTVSWD